MLKEFEKMSEPSEAELEKRLGAAREELAKKQILIKEKKLPVLIVLEGWDAAGKGSILGKIIKNMDPRFFKVSVMHQASEEELREPFLYRYFVKIPAAGKFMFFDGSWMDEVTRGYLKHELSPEDYKKRIQSIRRFERTLTDNGYLVMKFFFQISKKEQKKRLEGLLGDKNTKWRVEEGDLWQNKHYEECMKVYEQYIDDTNQSTAPWYLIDSKNKKWAELQMLEMLLKNIDIAVQNTAKPVPLLQNLFPLERFHG